MLHPFLPGIRVEIKLLPHSQWIVWKSHLRISISRSNPLQPNIAWESNSKDVVKFRVSKLYLIQLAKANQVQPRQHQESSDYPLVAFEATGPSCGRDFLASLSQALKVLRVRYLKTQQQRVVLDSYSRTKTWLPSSLLQLRSWLLSHSSVASGPNHPWWVACRCLPTSKAFVKSFKL